MPIPIKEFKERNLQSDAKKAIHEYMQKNNQYAYNQSDLAGLMNLPLSYVSIGTRELVKEGKLLKKRIELKTYYALNQNRRGRPQKKQEE